MRQRSVAVSVAPACVAAALVHLSLITRALGPDEGGFSVVARYWNEPGPYLYGPVWVDRPPGLIALFSLANKLGPLGVRLMVTILAVALVAFVAACAVEVGGRAAAPWAAWTAFALGSSTLLQAQQLNGEYAAIVFVSASIWMTLRALSGPRPAWIYGTAAGIAGGAALTMKQNFLDGFVFAGLLLVATAITSPSKRRRSIQAAAGGVLGAVVVAGAVWWWSVGHSGLDALLEAVYGFRAQATLVQGRTLDAPSIRFAMLIVLCVASGLLLIAGQVLWQGRHAIRRRNPLAWAIAGTALFELVSVLAGANFWPHYVLAFVPIIAIGAGVGSRRVQPGWAWTRGLVVAAVLAASVIGPASAALQGPGNAWAAGRWIARSAHPNDTIVVTYTHPNVVDASGLRPAYPYLWSLPIRTLDPNLRKLTASLSGPHRATWMVAWNKPKEWGLDQRKQLGHVLNVGYTRLPRVCHRVVWLRNDVHRSLAPRPIDCGGGAL